MIDVPPLLHSVSNAACPLAGSERNPSVRPCGFCPCTSGCSACVADVGTRGFVIGFWTGGCSPNRYSSIASLDAGGILAGSSASNWRRLKSSPRALASSTALSYSHLSTRFNVLPVFLSVPTSILGNGVVWRPLDVVTTSPAASFPPTSPRRGCPVGPVSEDRSSPSALPFLVSGFAGASGLTVGEPVAGFVPVPSESPDVDGD